MNSAGKMNQNSVILPTNLYDFIQKAVEFIKARIEVGQPETALIFGSGLGAISSGMEIQNEILYGEIPGFAQTTLNFHKGRLLFGNIGGHSVVAMDGRFHYYEGWSMLQITFPVRVMRALGAKRLLLSNIAGGLNPDYRAGEIVVITDHINMLGTNPLIGFNDERLGPRFLDMIEPYSKRLIELAEKQARAMGMRLPRGVYLALPGSLFETRAEYRMIRQWGADLVGMSSVPEVIAAVHGGMEALALSLVSDECFPECLAPLEVPVLLNRAEEGAGKIAGVFRGVIAQIRNN